MAASHDKTFCQDIQLIRAVLLHAEKLKRSESPSCICNPQTLLFPSEASKDAKSKLAGTLDELGGETSELAARFLAKSAVLAGVTHILTTYGAGISSLSTHILYGETGILDRDTRPAN